jgi:agmatinase
MTIKPFTQFGGVEVPDAGFEKARIIVLPLCYEHSPSYGAGSGAGPFHILEASVQLERMEEETLIDWGLFRIHTLPPMTPCGSPEQAVADMKTAAEKIMAKGKFLLSLGGDHAITIGPAIAASRIYPNLGIVQVDAHMDLRDQWNGSRYNHACVMRRIDEEAGIPMVQVGIRAFCAEELDYVRRRNLRPVYAHTIDPADNSWIQEAVERLPENVYLSIDLDGLDPSVLPATGTPEPGGLSFRQLVSLIKAVGRGGRVVAADINELAKIHGSPVSEYTAAKIATKIFIHCADREAVFPERGNP